MLSKESRLAYLKTRHAALFGVAISGLLPVSRSEIRETAQETVSAVASQNNDNILDEELDGVKSVLPFEQVKISSLKGESEESLLLTRKEKAQLANDLRVFRFRRIAIPRVLLLTA